MSVLVAGAAAARAVTGWGDHSGIQKGAPFDSKYSCIRRCGGAEQELHSIEGAGGWLQYHGRHQG